MKKFIILLIAVSLSFNIVSAETQTVFEQLTSSIIMFIGDNQVVVNGSLKNIDENPDVYPFIENGRTLVPLRFIIEEFNGIVEWREKTSEIEIKIGNGIFIFQIGSKTVYINGNSVDLDTSPLLYREKTFVPIRVISENIGKSVYYINGVIVISDEKTEIEILEKEKQEEIVYALRTKKYFEDYIAETVLKTKGYPKIFPDTKYASIDEGGSVSLKPVYKDVRKDVFLKKIKDEKIKFKAVSYRYLLSADNNLYIITVETGGKNAPYVSLKLVKSNILDFSVGVGILITLNTDGQVEVQKDVGGGEYTDITMNRLLKTDKEIIVEQKIYSGLDNVKYVFAGYDICFVIKQDGSLWGWGLNDCGQVGVGDKDNIKEPTLISGISNVKYLTTYYKHVLCIKDGDTLWGWGDNTDFQISVDAMHGRKEPTEIKSISDVEFIDTKLKYTLAKKSDGTIWWVGNRGYNPAISNSDISLLAYSFKELNK